MVRPRILEDGKILSVSLDRSDLEILEKQRGTLGFSAHIRNLIREETQRSDIKTGNEMVGIQKELREANAELAAYKRKERLITKAEEEQKRTITEGFKQFAKNNKRSEEPLVRQGWLESRCRGSGVTPIIMLAHFQDIGLLELESYERAQGS